MTNVCILCSLKLTRTFPSAVSCSHRRPEWQLESSEEYLPFGYSSPGTPSAWSHFEINSLPEDLCALLAVWIPAKTPWVWQHPGWILRGEFLLLPLQAEVEMGTFPSCSLGSGSGLSTLRLRSRLFDCPTLQVSTGLSCLLLRLSFLLLFFSFLIKVWLIHHIVPISAIQHSVPISLSLSLTHTHTHTLFLFSYYLPSWSIPRDWRQFPALYSRTSLLTHSKCNSLHLPTPNSPSIPFSPLSLWNHKSVLHVSVSASVL